MKKLVAAVAAFSFAFLPYAPAVAAGDLPVSKTLVATIPVPWGSQVPSASEFLAFSCGTRAYLVWQSQVPGGYTGQRVSKLYAFGPDGKEVKTYWQEMAMDSESSTVRFTGTCVGDRAVMTNHWEDAVHQTAGDMATSVTGEEGIGPFWKPDGKTIYMWYSTAGDPVSRAFPVQRLHILLNKAFISGRVLKTATSFSGSSANYILSPSGIAYVSHAPWYKDMAKVALPDAQSVAFVDFVRADYGWQADEQMTGPWDMTGFASSTHGYRSDTAVSWLTSPRGRYSYMTEGYLEERCVSDFRGAANPYIQNDGLYFTSGACSVGNVVVTVPGVRIHVASSSDIVNAPRIYTRDKKIGRSGDSFAYAVRTGDQKIQVWRAVVK